MRKIRGQKMNYSTQYIIYSDYRIPIYKMKHIEIHRAIEMKHIACISVKSSIPEENIPTQCKLHTWKLIQMQDTHCANVLADLVK